MDEKSLFTKFWTNESKTTLKVLARIPEGSDLPSGSEVAHRAGDRVADRLRGEDDHRGARNGQGGMGAAADAGDDEGSASTRMRSRAPTMPQRWKALPAARWDGTLEFFGNQRPGVAHGLEFSLRHRSPSRADHDLPSADGIDGAADLRTER